MQWNHYKWEAIRIIDYQVRLGRFPYCDNGQVLRSDKPLAICFVERDSTNTHHTNSTVLITLSTLLHLTMTGAQSAPQEVLNILMKNTAMEHDSLPFLARED